MKIHVRFPKISKNRFETRQLSKSVLSTPSELGERSIWSLASRRSDLGSKIIENCSNPHNGEISVCLLFLAKFQTPVTFLIFGVERMDWTCKKLRFFSSKKIGVPIAYNKNHFWLECDYAMYKFRTFISTLVKHFDFFVYVRKQTLL